MASVEFHGRFGCPSAFGCVFACVGTYMTLLIPYIGQQLSRRPARAAYTSTVLNRHAFTAADVLEAGEGA